jgi:hypothetical protein
MSFDATRTIRGEVAEELAKLAEARAKDLHARADRLTQERADYRLVTELRLAVLEILDLARAMRERVA